MVIITVWVLFNCCNFSPPPLLCIWFQPQSGSKSRFKKWHHIVGWCKVTRPQLFLQPQTDLMRNAVFTIVRPQKQLSYAPTAGLTSETSKSLSLQLSQRNFLQVLGGKKKSPQGLFEEAGTKFATIFLFASVCIVSNFWFCVEEPQGNTNCMQGALKKAGSLSRGNTVATSRI